MEDAQLEALVRGLVLLFLLLRFIAIFLPFAIGGKSFGSLLGNLGISETATRLLDNESMGKGRDFFWNCVILDVFGHLFPELGSKLKGSRNALDVEPCTVITMLDQVGIDAVLGKKNLNAEKTDEVFQQKAWVSVQGTVRCMHASKCNAYFQ